VGKLRTVFATCLHRSGNASTFQVKSSGVIGAISRLAKKMAGWEDTKKWFTQLIVGWLITSLAGGVPLLLAVELC
jgi:hypothetical protein